MKLLAIKHSARKKWRWLGLIFLEHTLTDMRILTEEAKFDDKIKKQLTNGKMVVITSGLLKATQEKLNDIVELRYTDRKAIVQNYTRYFSTHPHR